MDLVWTVIDIDELRDWPDYPKDAAERFSFVNWPAACSMAIAMIDVGAVWEPLAVPDDLPDGVRVGLELLVSTTPIDATPGQLTDGGHRLLAMKGQGVRFTVGGAWQELSSDGL